MSNYAVEPVDVGKPDQPSTQLAYEWVEKSHEWMLNRMIAQGDRASRILTLALTLTLGVPAIVRTNFSSPFFIEAMVVFVFLVLIGASSHDPGPIRLIAIADLRANVHRQPEIFRRGILYTAEKNWLSNKQSLASLARAVDGMTKLLGLEVVCLILWIVWP